MKRLKEWLSDNLRYLILFLAVIVGIFAIVLGVRLYGLLSGQIPVVQDPVTERVTERTDEIVILGQDETESESESETDTDAVTEKESESESEKDTEAVSETEKTKESESETEAQTETKPAGTVQNVRREETEAETQDGGSTSASQGGISITVIDDGTSNSGQTEESENSTTSSADSATDRTSTSGEAELKTLKSRTAATMYVNTDSNIRSGPGTNYRIISYASYGDAIQVTGETTSWYQVKTDEGTGYIAKSLLDEDEIYIEPEYATVVSACNIRSSADYGDNVIGELYGGEQVEVHYVDGWAYITYNGITGYIGARFISY